MMTRLWLGGIGPLAGPGIWFSLKRLAHLGEASFRTVVLGLVLRES